MKFVFALHAKIDWGAIGKLKGQTDIELYDSGRQQAHELAKKVSKLDITLVVSSDLKRARQTAEIINNTLHVPLYLEKGLRECSFGRLEGLTKQQVLQKNSELSGYWGEDCQDYDFTAFGGENHDQVLARHLKILQKYSKSNPHEIVLIVGHSRGLSTLLANLKYSPQIKREEYIEVKYIC